MLPLLALLVCANPSQAESTAALNSLRAALAKGQPLAELAERDIAQRALTKADAAVVRQLLWQSHAEHIRKERAAEIKDNRLIDGDKSMPIFLKTFGEKPKAGHSLWISMHGGGNASKRINDSQWENQKKLYTLTEGIYCAPRAPTNSWNLWHEPHIDRLFARLIEDFIVLHDVDPDRVYLMGYSAGGDGVYAMAPRMADSWAAAAMMAGHPNGIPILSLRNLPIALQCGGKDAAYNRNKVTAEYGAKLDELQKADPGGYQHFVKIHEGKPHWMGGEDKVALPWMAKHTRNPIPDRVVWMQTGTTHDRFYWLAIPPGTGKIYSMVDVKLTGQTIEIVDAKDISRLLIRLDDRMLDLDRPVKVVHKDKTLFDGMAPRSIGTLVRTLSGRGDPKLIFDAEIAVTLP